MRGELNPVGLQNKMCTGVAFVSPYSIDTAQLGVGCGGPAHIFGWDTYPGIMCNVYTTGLEELAPSPYTNDLQEYSCWLKISSLFTALYKTPSAQMGVWCLVELDGGTSPLL